MIDVDELIAEARRLEGDYSDNHEVVTHMSVLADALEARQQREADFDDDRAVVEAAQKLDEWLRKYDTDRHIPRIPIARQMLAGFSRAAVPDAATERARQAEAELRDMLRVDIPSLKAERDAALARITDLEDSRDGTTIVKLAEAEARIAEAAKLHRTHTDELDGAQFCKECGWVAGYCNTARALGLNEGENDGKSDA